LNTQSLDESLPLVTDIQKYTLSADNQILDEHIPRVQQVTYRIEKRVDREGESLVVKKLSSALDRLGPKVKSTDRPVVAPEKSKSSKSSQDEYDSWGDVVEEDEANQSQETIVEDPCPIDPPRPKSTKPESRTSSEGARRVVESEPEPRKRTARRIEPEPSKRVRDDSSKSAESASQYKSSDSQADSSDESVISSSSDEEERKER